MQQISDFWMATVWADGWYERAQRRRHRQAAPDTPSPRPLEATEGENKDDCAITIAQQDAAPASA